MKRTGTVILASMALFALPPLQAQSQQADRTKEDALREALAAASAGQPKMAGAA